MMRVILAMIVLSAQPAASVPRNPVFEAEVARVRTLAKKADANLVVNSAIVAEDGKNHGYIGIKDKKRPALKFFCVFDLDLSPWATSKISTRATKMVYERRDEDIGVCARFIVTEETDSGLKDVDRSVCLIGDALWNVSYLNDGDPELEVSAKLVCLGAECDRQP